MSTTADEGEGSVWCPLPDPPAQRISRQRLLHAASLAAAGGSLNQAVTAAEPDSKLLRTRSVRSADSWPAIPVWPAWAGGRVIPISPDPSAADPFLLLAHHKHSFTPGDPLRYAFKTVGGAIGLPYVGEEGFKMHPHRGMDIFTYILDGSDGFRHRDSLGGECTYRGGAGQFMRSGRGAMHEEMWETRSDRTTSIELFQLWLNLPGKQKLQPAAIRYVGKEWGAPFQEEEVVDERGGVTKVRVALDSSLLDRASKGEGEELRQRPEFAVLHATLQARARWTPRISAGHTAMLYVRRGSVLSAGEMATAGNTILYTRDGNAISLYNLDDSRDCDVLLLTGAPLREPVALGGPIVMNTQEELEQAYRELREGTFLNA